MSTDKTLPQLDPKTSALVLIDLQKGITSFPSQPLTAQEVITNAQKLLNIFRKKNALVVLVHVTSSPDGKDMLHPTADEPMMRGGERPKDWADFVPEVAPLEGDIIITKRQWGAFYGTELDMQLRRRGIKTIVLGGIATNIGVESTARDAFERGYDLIFVEDAMSSMSKGDHEFALSRIFPRIGRIRTAKVIGNALGK
jgi:nicotinamidase-related amidase